MRSYRGFRWLLALVTALFACEIATVAGGVLGWLSSITLNKVWECAFSAGAVIAWAASARKHRDPRHRWQWWMTAAMTGFTIGVFSWSWAQVAGATSLPTGTLGPAGFIVTPILALLALLIRTSGGATGQPWPLTGAGRNRTVQVLDLVIIASSMLLFASAALAEPLSRRSVLMVTNSLAHLLLVAVIVILLRARPGTRDPQIVFVGVGAAAYLASSILFTHYTKLGVPIPPWLETGFLACPTLYFLAAFAPTSTKGMLSDSSRGSTRDTAYLAIPYLPLIGTVLFLAAGLAMGVLLNGLQQSILLTLMSLAVFRQLVTMLEKGSLLRRAEHEALHDPLTGLANRTLLLHQLERSLTSCAESGRSMALVFCDMDDFKEINDNLGHEAGDLVLKETAKRLQRCAAPGDTIARLGGDEFAIVLKDAHQPLDQVGDRFLRAVQEPHTINGNRLVVSVSIGIARVSSENSVTSCGELLRMADTAMYAAKRRGKNTLAEAVVSSNPADATDAT